jgi:hypothetical protein
MFSLELQCKFSMETEFPGKYFSTRNTNATSCLCETSHQIVNLSNKYALFQSNSVH